MRFPSVRGETWLRRSLAPGARRELSLHNEREVQILSAAYDRSAKFQFVSAIRDWSSCAIDLVLGFHGAITSKG